MESLHFSSHSTDDKNSLYSLKVPTFQLYPESINEVDVLLLGQPSSIDNICTTKDLLNNKFDLARKSLEFNGKIK